MQPQPPTGPEPPDEQPGRAASRRGLRGLVVAGAVLVLVAAGASGAALARGGDGSVDSFAATGSATTDEGGTDDTDGTDDDRDGRLRDRLRDWATGRGPMLRHGMMGKGLVGGMLGGPLLGAPLHGSYVVEDRDGGYRTVLSQRGEATSVSSTSLTVRSDDGFEATYRLTDDTSVLSGSDGTDDIERGAEVTVTALESGGSARALHVVDISQLEDRFEHHFGDRPGRPDDDSPQPSETATSGARA